MDWKKWKSILLEDYDSKILKLGHNEIQKGKQILDNFVSKNNQFILFDLETSGLTEDYLKDKSAERQQEQITEIAGLLITLKLDNGKLVVEKGDNVDYFIELKDFVKARLDKDSEAYKKHVLHKINIALQKLNLKEPTVLTDFSQIESLPEQSEGFKWEKKEDKWFKKNTTSNVKEVAKKAYDSATNYDTAKVLELTRYYDHEDKPKLDEKEALVKFLAFIKKYPNAVLSGQNVESFDLKFLDQRMKEYNLDSLSKHNRKFLDTIHIARNMLHPALKQMEEYFSSKLEQIDNELEDNSKIDQTLLENQEVFSSIMSQGEDFVNSYPEEKRELAKLKFIFTILYNKTKQTREELYDKKTKRYTSSQGPLATVFKIKTDNWHNALADVEMLSGLFNSMYNLLDFAIKYTDGALTEEILSEMEPYQRAVTAKHPAAKKRLTGLGKNLDKSSPYKMKLSYKRGKSAPPGG